MREVSYARSTYRKAHEFQQGIEELSARMPLWAARAYLATGEMLTGYVAEDYTRVDELQELRKSAIGAEMQYVQAQVKVHGCKEPDLVRRVAEAEGHTTGEADALATKAVEGALTAEELFGHAAVTGDDIRFGFGPDALELAPSLGVYALVMWLGKNELAGVVEGEIRDQGSVPYAN